MEAVLIVSGVFLLIAVVVAIAWYMDKKRTEAISNLADTLGLEFIGKCDLETLEGVNQFQLFQRGRSKTVKNLLQGETEIAKIQIFDYSYTTGSGKNSTTHNQTVVCMTSPQINAPQFDLSPEGYFSRFTEWFGAQDIDFDEHEEFSNAFQLAGFDHDAIREYFDVPLMDFFCQRKSQNVSTFPSFLIFFRSRTTASPDEWKDLMTEGFAVYQAFLERAERS